MGNAEHPAPTTTHHPDNHPTRNEQTGTTMTTQDRKKKRPTPAHWQLFFDQKGIRSINHLAEIAGVSGMTANRLVMGDSKSTPEILRRVAQALRVDDAVIFGLAGWPTSTKPWQPPAEAEAMDDRQRKAVTELIRAFVAPAFQAAEEEENEAQEEDATVHELRGVPFERDHLGLAAWERDEDEAPTYREHLDSLGEDPQD